MAKLGVYYGLCPLIDHRSLLGISEDADSANVIVTLGKNIAIKYKLSDQKQLHSWRTKEKFSSPVLYDKEISKYVAVFNHSYIRTWSSEDEVIDKLRKLKFTQQIYTIFTCNSRNYILFMNGAIKSLNEAIESRKSLILEDIFDSTKGYIVEILHCSITNENYIGLVVMLEDIYHLYWTKFSVDILKFSKIQLSRDNFELTGYVFHVDQNIASFLSLWNDGSLYSLELRDLDQELQSPGNAFSLIEFISCKEPVSLISLNDNYIALYGCNCNDEGALLMVYNVQFKTVQSKLSFKLYTKGAKLWRVQENLLLPVGQNLAVVPFHLDKEQLAALVGSHMITDPDLSVVQSVKEAHWKNSRKSHKSELSAELTSRIEESLSQGLSENAILEQLLSEQDKTEVDILSQALDYFSDISEKCLCKLLKLFLCSNLKSCEAQFEDWSAEKQNLIDKVLVRPFSDVLLLPYLRSVLNLDEALILLRYINFLLKQGDCLPKIDLIQSEAKLIQWGSAILDANYQRLLLIKDDNILKILVTFNEFVSEELKSLQDIQSVAPLINLLKSGKDLRQMTHLASLSYSVEEMSLY